jgi:hypothetical protein
MQLFSFDPINGLQVSELLCPIQAVTNHKMIRNNRSQEVRLTIHFTSFFLVE